jgi:CubicO group peptidase (beta-lactamase class C family)
VSKRVVDYIPEFGTNGKDVITVEQVMLHTSGFPHAPFNALDWADKEKRYARFAKWRTNWEPGTRFEYHPTSAHWVLAELIERASGEDFRTFIRSRIIEPLGITRYELGVPPEREPSDRRAGIPPSSEAGPERPFEREVRGDINTLVNTGEPVPAEELQRLFGIDALPVTEVTPEALIGFNHPKVRAVGVPGGGGVSTAADLALYYQGILHNPGIWKPDVLTDVTTQVRNTFPDYIGTPANRSRGLVIAGDDGKSGARGMGKTVSPRAFGHNGAGGQIAWADPETGLSFCYLMNGLDQNQLRGWRLTTAIASRAGKSVHR